MGLIRKRLGEAGRTQAFPVCDTVFFLFLALQIFPLISQSRWLVKSGELMALEFSISPGLRRKLNTRPVHLHLFNDCLLLSRPRESVTRMRGQSTRGKWDEARGRDWKGQRKVMFLQEPFSVAHARESKSWPREEEKGPKQTGGSCQIISTDPMAGPIPSCRHRAKCSALAYHMFRSVYLCFFGLGSA